MRALPRPRDQPGKPVDRRPLDPPPAQLLARAREQERRTVVLERKLRQPRPELRSLRISERSPARMRANSKPMLPPRRRPDRIVEHRPRRHVQRDRERLHSRGRRGGEILGDEPQPAQRAQLQRDPELACRPALGADELQIVAGQAEVLGEVIAVDRLRKGAQPRELGA